MMDELKQELGFDAAKAIQTLKDLDKTFEGFEQGIGRAVKVLDAFNKKSGGTVSALKKIAAEGAKAVGVLQKLGGFAGAPGPGTAGPGAAGGGRSPGVDAYIAQLKQMYRVSADASTQTKRAFESQITKTAELAAKSKLPLGNLTTMSRKLGTTYTGAANKVADGMAKIEASSHRSLNAAGLYVRKLTVDFQTMVRIVTTQAIVRALSALRNGLNAAVIGALEFERAVAEVRTISPDKNLERLKNSIHAVSDEFNVPLGTAAEAYYQTISNQVASATSDVEQFVSATSRFSKVGVADLDTAVNLVSGTLNAYGMNVSEADHVSATFFKTIELGRTRADELANSFGTVAPLAAKLGVELEELQAAFATVTIAGVDTSKATTQLRGVLQAFIKPTSDMKAALKELGYASGEQLLSAMNLGEALVAVTQKTDGSSAAIAKLFPRVRGLVGELILSADGAQKFADNLTKIENEADKAFREQYELYIDTNAERVTRELNKLKNFFTREFGEDILKAGVTLFDFAQGAETIANVFRSIAAVLPVATVALTGFGLVMAGAAVKNWLFAESATAAERAAWGLKSALGALGLALAAVAVVEFVVREVKSAAKAEKEAAIKASKAITMERQRKVAEEISLEKKKLKKVIQLYNQEMAEVRKIALERQRLLKETDAVVIQDVRWSLDEILRARKRTVDALSDSVKKFDDTIKSSKDGIRDLKSSLNDLLFQRGLKKLPEEFQFREVLDRANQESQRAAKLLRSATSQEGRELAQAAHKRAVALNEQAYSLAGSLKHQSYENQVNKQAVEITNRMVNAEEMFQRSTVTSKKAMDQSAQAAANWYRQLKETADKLVELTSPFDKEDNPFSQDELKKRSKEYQSLLADFLRKTQSGVKDFGALPVDIHAIPELTLLNVPKYAERMKGQLKKEYEARINQNPIRLEIEAFAEIKDIKLGTGQRFDQASAEFNKAMQDSLQLKQTARGLENAFDEAFRQAAISMKGVEVPELSDYSGDDPVRKYIAEEIAARNKLFTKTNEIIAARHIEISQLQELADLGQNYELTYGKRVDVDSAGQAWLNLVNGYHAMEKSRENVHSKFFQGNTEEAEKAKQLLQIYKQTKAVREGRYTEGMKTIDAQNQQTTAAQGTLDKLSAILAVQREINRITADTAKGMSSPGEVATAAKGGWIRYLASGGSARGLDRIPAMLAKDEYVVNPSSSRRFFSQLQAINAGVQPVYRERGGSVTNIGDVSISVNESGTPRQTAREVMTEIRRAKRRGSARF